MIHGSSATTGLSVVDAARVVGALQWAAGGLHQLIAGWVPATEDPAATVWLTMISRTVGSHVPALIDVMPDSVLLAPSAHVGPASPELPGVFEGIDSFANGPGSGDQMRIFAARILVESLITDCEGVVSRCSSHGDGAVARVIRELAVDLGDGLAEGVASVGRGQSPAYGTDIDAVVFIPSSPTTDGVVIR